LDAAPRAADDRREPGVLHHPHRRPWMQWRPAGGARGGPAHRRASFVVWALRSEWRTFGLSISTPRRASAAKEPMTVRPDYALSRARYTHFLFTVVGSERRGTQNSSEDITVPHRAGRASASSPWHGGGAPVGIAARRRRPSPWRRPFVNLPDTRWAAGDATGAARRIINTLPEPSHRAPARLSPRTFLAWGLWAAVGLALALIAVNYMVSAVGPLTSN